MPTYEYRCQSCGDQFEIVQSFSDASLKVCAKCTGELRKVYGNVGISFKGSGFYKNDARVGSSSNGSSTPASTDSSTSSSSEASAAKPAAEPSSGSTGSSHAAPAPTPAATPSS